jgi:hypothetical protein
MPLPQHASRWFSPFFICPVFAASARIPRTAHAVRADFRRTASSKVSINVNKVPRQLEACASARQLEACAKFAGSQRVGRFAL